ncbi:unspecified product [Plasmodium malariae]|uniref:Unspecified product n=1 Tax=Plasmodium malariae TaxID=5858 RepID=A0A1A8WPK1_PLAMA|nr:unspecified product [Plasmodium malariae]
MYDNNNNFKKMYVSNTFGKKWEQNIHLNNVLGLKSNRLLKAITETKVKQRYARTKEKKIDSSENDDVLTDQLTNSERNDKYGNVYKMLMHDDDTEQEDDELKLDDPFSKPSNLFKFDAIKHFDKFNKRFKKFYNIDYLRRPLDLLKCNRYYKELIHLIERNAGFKFGLIKKKIKTLPEALKHNDAKSEPWILKLIKKIDAKFELELLLFLKRITSTNDDTNKPKNICEKSLYYTKKYKIVFPPIINFLILIIIIANSTSSARI